MDAATRELVRQRAGFRCEYCLLRQDQSGLSHHIEHIIAKQHGGPDEPDNLALACNRCNAHKGPNLTGIDPASGDIVSLFHPRRDVWTAHFEWLIRDSGVVPASILPQVDTRYPFKCPGKGSALLCRKSLYRSRLRGFG